MSNLFLKNNTKNKYNNTESSINLTEILGMNTNKVKNARESATSSINVGNYDDSATSSVNQKLSHHLSATSTINNLNGGGYNILSATSTINNLNNINLSATSTINNLNNINLSATSSINNLNGGGINSLSNSTDNNISKINSNDINNLLSMLTSETNENNTTTSKLENKLKNLLVNNNIAGGSNNNLFVDSESTEMLQNKINNIVNRNNLGNTQSGGALKSLITLGTLGAIGTMLNKKINEESEFNSSKVLGNDNDIKQNYNNKFNTESQEPNPFLMQQSNNQTNYQPENNKIFMQQPNNQQNNQPLNLNTTTTIENDKRVDQLSYQQKQFNQQKPFNQQPFNQQQFNQQQFNQQQNQPPVSTEQPQFGGSSEEFLNNQDGGDNPGFDAFRKLSAMVSEKLEIPNGKIAKIIAKKLKGDVISKQGEMSHDKLFIAAKKHLENNMSTYKKLI